MKLAMYIQSSQPKELKAVVQLEGQVPDDLGKQIVANVKTAFDMVRMAVLTLENAPELLELRLRLQGSEDARYWEATLFGDKVQSDMHVALIVSTFRFILKGQNSGRLTGKYELDEAPFDAKAVRDWIKRIEMKFGQLAKAPEDPN